MIIGLAGTRNRATLRGSLANRSSIASAPASRKGAASPFLEQGAAGISGKRLERFGHERREDGQHPVRLLPRLGGRPAGGGLRVRVLPTGPRRLDGFGSRSRVLKLVDGVLPVGVGVLEEDAAVKRDVHPQFSEGLP